ncbi:hypothetical protein KM043_004973 [Ampulex compressa]|nr:hypothetical protein KM043_004973 [Ampulex compressa]
MLLELAPLRAYFLGPVARNVVRCGEGQKTGCAIGLSFRHDSALMSDREEDPETPAGIRPSLRPGVRRPVHPRSRKLKMPRCRLDVGAHGRLKPLGLLYKFSGDLKNNRSSKLSERKKEEVSEEFEASAAFGHMGWRDAEGRVRPTSRDRYAHHLRRALERIESIRDRVCCSVNLP